MPFTSISLHCLPSLFPIIMQHTHILLCIIILVIVSYGAQESNRFSNDLIFFFLFFFSVVFTNKSWSPKAAGPQGGNKKAPLPSTRQNPWTPRQFTTLLLQSVSFSELMNELDGISVVLPVVDLLSELLHFVAPTVWTPRPSSRIVWFGPFTTVYSASLCE